MADSDIWNPAPRIKVKFSQHLPENTDVLLTYSTDMEKVDPKKAREQASILAEQHFENILKQFRVAKKSLFGKSEKSTARCALIDEHSILFRDSGIIAVEEQEDEAEAEAEAEAQHLMLVSSSGNQMLTNLTLRLPCSDFEYTGNATRTWRFRIRARMDFSEWKATVGNSNYWGRARSSSKSEQPQTAYDAYEHMGLSDEVRELPRA